LARDERLRAETEVALRPVALALLEGEEVSVEELSVQDQIALADLLGRYGRLVRGVDTGRIAAFFERRGAIDYELDQTRSRRVWRRATAAFALGDMGSPRAIPRLLALLDDRNRDVRAAAARSLGRLGAEEAVEPLVYAFVDSHLPRSVTGQARRPEDALPAASSLAAGPPEALWAHRRLVANPRYGSLGMFAIPYFVAFELVGPIVQVLGYPVVIVAFLMGAVSVEFLAAFLLMSVLLGILLSVSALALEEFSFRRHVRDRDVAKLLLYAVLENFGYRQLNDFWRVQAFFDLARRRRHWGEMRRRGLGLQTPLR